MKPDRRRTTKLTSTAGPILRDVVELKQAALWHGGKIRIDQAHYPAFIKSTQNHCRLHI